MFPEAHHFVTASALKTEQEASVHTPRNIGHPRNQAIMNKEAA